MRENEIIECVFGDRLFSGNFCYFDAPIFEYTEEQKIKLINERYSVFEQKKILELYLLYKSLPTLKQGFIKNNYYIYSNLGIKIRIYKELGYYTIYVKGKPIKKTFDSIEEARSYIGFYYPRLILNKKHLIF